VPSNLPFSRSRLPSRASVVLPFDSITDSLGVELSSNTSAACAPCCTLTGEQAALSELALATHSVSVCCNHIQSHRKKNPRYASNPGSTSTPMWCGLSTYFPPGSSMRPAIFNLLSLPRALRVFPSFSRFQITAAFAFSSILLDQAHSFAC
jgi:hypothetical protein